jgi:alpha-mannosidase
MMPKITEVLVIPHTHHDIGYTHVPDICLSAHEQGIYEALDLCEQDLLDTTPAAFRWTVEISRPLQQFLNHAAAADVQRLQTLVSQERVSITAGYLHMTQLIGDEEYRRFFMPVRAFREQYGLPVSTVQHGDINGLGWGSVPLMHEVGLDTLVMALNPDHGRAPFEQPSAFYWEGQDGSRVLAWLSIHYGLAGHTWKLLTGQIGEAVTPITKLVQRLEAREDYPFDFLVAHAAFDNMMPDKKLVDSVRLWNAEGLLPPLRIATMDMAMARAKAQAASANLPVHRGEWADWWAHGHGSSAYEVAVSRQTRATMRTAEFSAALEQHIFQSEQKREPAGTDAPIIAWYGSSNFTPVVSDWQAQTAGVYDNLLLFEEHTWGAFESIYRPSSVFTQTHWNQKAAFAYHAESSAHDLNREAFSQLAAHLPSADHKNLVILNPLPFRRDDLITLTTAAEEQQLFVENLPPLGIKVIPLPSVEPVSTVDLPADGLAVLENAHYRLEVDPGTASITRLYDKALDREWVDADALSGIGGVVYEEADASDSHPAIHTHRRHFHPNTPGPRFKRTVAEGCGSIQLRRDGTRQTLTVQASAPYLPKIQLAITLYARAKWIDLTVLLEKDENYGMEGVYVLFPFALAKPTFYLESANAVYRAGVEQLPDTCRDWYSIQHGAGISDGESSVLWATREAPLVQLGGFHTGEWSRELRLNSGHLYAWLMNNLYFTNFKGAQGGQHAFSFRFTTQAGEVQPADVTRWGQLFGIPPFAATAPVQEGTYEWIEVSPDTALVEYVKSGMENTKALVLRLRETGGRAQTATLTWKRPGRVRLTQTSFLESGPRTEIDGDGHTFQIRLNPYQQITIEVISEQDDS